MQEESKGLTPSISSIKVLKKIFQLGSMASSAAIILIGKNTSSGMSSNSIEPIKQRIEKCFSMQVMEKFMEDSAKKMVSDIVNEADKYKTSAKRGRISKTDVEMAIRNGKGTCPFKSS